MVTPTTDRAGEPIRIWHQSLTVLAHVPAYRDALQKHIDSVVSPGTEVDLHGLVDGSYSTSYPGSEIIYNYVTSRHVEQFVEAAVTAEREGYDAFVIATLPDLGYEQIRSVVDIPVIPIGLTSVTSAIALGDCVGLVGFIDELAPWVRRNMSLVGLDRVVGPFASLGATFHDVMAEMEGPDKALRAFEDAAARLIEQGANVIVPGEGPLNVLLARHQITRVHDVPVIDSMGSTFGLADIRAREYRRTGIYPSRSGYYFARPPAELFEGVRNLYGRGPSATNP